MFSFMKAEISLYCPNSLVHPFQFFLWQSDHQFPATSWGSFPVAASFAYPKQTSFFSAKLKMWKDSKISDIKRKNWSNKILLILFLFHFHQLMEAMGPGVPGAHAVRHAKKENSQELVNAILQRLSMAENTVKGTPAIQLLVTRMFLVRVRK